MQQINHYLTFFIVAWFLSIVTFATWIILTSPQEIPLSAVTVLGTIYGIPAIAAALWKWSGNTLVVEIEDKEGTIQQVQPNDANVYIFEYNPKEHKLRIRNR